MIYEIGVNCQEVFISSDLAGEFPIYIYLLRNRRQVLYAKSISELLSDFRVKKDLKVSSFGISFLLQSGVVAPPYTVFENLFILSIGFSARVYSCQQSLNISFEYDFYFSRRSPLRNKSVSFDSKYFLEILAEATVSRMDLSKPSFLFHSAGKDSNTIALALAEAGWQDRVCLITHKSKGRLDESGISTRIARKLGFQNQILEEVDELRVDHIEELVRYFKNSPLPSLDNVSLAYPLYNLQYSSLRNSNIIDGGGNDSYMMTLLSKRDYLVIRFSKLLSKLSYLRKVINSEGLFNPLLRTPAEWFGMSGLSYSDCKCVYPSSISVYDHWLRESRIREKWDPIDFKTDIVTSVVASELHLRKVRAYADSFELNLVLPFASPNIVGYLLGLNECDIFDVTKGRNKVIIRELLKEHIGLDSDRLGKMGYIYDSSGMVLKNIEFIVSEIRKCSLWSETGANELVSRLRNKVFSNRWESPRAARVLYRIFLLSAWYNYTKYIN